MEIIRTVGEGDWCPECWSHACDPFDRDESMFVAQRLDSGRCACCGEVVVVGEPLDSAADL